MNFARFYPPYIDILFHIMKSDQIDDSHAALELNLHPFINLVQLDEMHIYLIISPGINGINLIIDSPLTNKLPLE